MIEWISVEERMPTETGQYLVFLRQGKPRYSNDTKNEEGFKIIRWRRSTAPRNKDRIVGHWGNCDTYVYKRITHWAALIKPIDKII